MAAEVFIKRGIVKSLKQLASSRQLQNDDFRPYDIESLAASETDAYIFIDQNREVLGVPREQDFHVTRLYETRKTTAAGYYPPREIVIEFVWREDVELTGSGFGSLKGTTYELWCGGALVFDTNGNLLHYALSDSNTKRLRAFRSYLRYLVEEGWIGGEEEDEEEEGEDENQLRSQRVRSTVSNGRLHLTRNPALRHEGRWHRKSR